MKRGTTIAARGVRVPPRLEQEIQKRIDELEHFYPDMIGCSIRVQGPGRRHRTGGPFEVHIDLRVPGGEPILVNRQHEERLDLAIGQAFDVADRRLEDFARIQRGDVKLRSQSRPD
ncbi:MAG TPA: HPF/RaiA family ribosome-associated protein [Gemmatimonadota bacterium]|jgi:ribosome-associated translation inhibitor RaiA